MLRSHLNVASYGVTHVLRQRENYILSPLAADSECARFPGNVADLKPGHFAGTQPEARDQEHDGVIARSSIALVVRGNDDPFDVRRADVTRQGRQAPAGNRGDRSVEANAATTFWSCPRSDRTLSDYDAS
jgi:hypothetical protein